MAYYMPKNKPAQKYVYIKQRIIKAQQKAKSVGVWYLLAMLAITVLACLPLMTITDEAVTHQLGVMTFWKVFTELGAGFAGKELALTVACIYALMLVILLVNVLRSFVKLDWLFKDKASRVYGFNRNMYAMDDIGNFFSGSLAAIVIAHLAIAFLVAQVTFHMLAYVCVGVGLFFHFVCGIAGGKVSVFETNEGVVEQAREVGSFGSFLRNVLQLVVCGAVAYFVLTSGCVRTMVADIFLSGNLSAYLAEPMKLLVPGLETIALVWWLGMTIYATSTKEYDLEAANAPGRKGFLIFALLGTLCMGASLAVSQFVMMTAITQTSMILTGIFAVALILELVLINVPAVEEQKPQVNDDVDTGSYLVQTYDTPGVYANVSTQMFED